MRLKRNNPAQYAQGQKAKSPIPMKKLATLLATVRQA
jgi:hypothetical protein